MRKEDNNPDSEFRCLIAGGGTGGHLFPGIAIANELKRRFKKGEILFVAGLQRKESEILSHYGYKVISIDVEGLKGRGWKKGFIVLAKLPKSLFQSASIIKAFSPDLVLGMGGYSAGPVCLAAKCAGVPTAIHEQNSYPGLTNRLLSRFVDRVFVSFEESMSYFKSKLPVLTGNPVRDEFFSDSDKNHKDRDKFTVLVVGGSQGAMAINKAFTDALIYLNDKGREFDVIHQTGEKDYQRVIEDYRDKGLEGKPVPFIKDMAMAYRFADIVVSRAGATTIFELAALGKPSILIPYPHAANQHQEINARSLVRAGGAEMINQSDLTGDGLAQTLMKYMDDRPILEKLGENAKKTGRCNAANVIADQLVKMMR